MNRGAPVGYDIGMDPIWLYEIRRCGPAALALPVAAATATAALTLSIAGPVAHLLAGSAVPLAAGLAVAAVAAREQMPELQHTLRTPYLLTVTRRLALVLLSSACAVLVSAGSAWRGGPDAVGSLLLTGASFTILLTGVAAFAANGSRSAGAASAVVTTVWLAKLLMLDQVVRDATAGGPLLLIAAIPCFWLAAARLSAYEPRAEGARR